MFMQMTTFTTNNGVYHVNLKTLHDTINMLFLGVTGYTLSLDNVATDKTCMHACG